MPVSKPVTKKLKAGPPVVNPLNKYASYTYSVRLWWLDIKDSNALQRINDPQEAMSYQLSKNSFVLAEDGGLSPDRRQPGTRGYNYYINDFSFKTHLGQGSIDKGTNILSGKMTIAEPYGSTLLETMIAASYDPNKNSFGNYTTQPMLLEIEFKGYDDRGQPATQADLNLNKKRFPIRLTKMDIAVSTKGAEYKIDFAPFGHQAFKEELFKTPADFTITAGTVKEFFDELSKQYYFYFAGQVASNNADYADDVRFEIDKSIASSTIVEEGQTPITRYNPKAFDLDAKKNHFHIAMGTPLNDIVIKVLAHSSYIIGQLKGLEGYANLADVLPEQQEIFNSYKVTASTEYKGRVIDINSVDTGTYVENAYDSRRNLKPRCVTLKIHQHPTWKAEHPNLPLLADGVPYIVKKYQYMYTGQNTDIVDFKINFNFTYYNSVLSQPFTVGANQATASTGKNLGYVGEDGAAPVNPARARLLINPAMFTYLDPRFGVIPNPTPQRYRMLTDNKNVSINVDNTRPSALMAADALHSIYSSKEMLKLDLTINGDPTLLKQDDWLYVPSPNIDNDYNNWDSLNQSEFCAKYGHIRTDVGEVNALILVSNPIDVDLDITNQGYAFPAPNTDYTYSVFSGLYRFLTIESKFSQGKFEQVLHLARNLNSSISQAVSASNSVDTTRTNDEVKKGINADKKLSTENGVPVNQLVPENGQNDRIDPNTGKLWVKE